MWAAVAGHGGVLGISWFPFLGNGVLPADPGKRRSVLSPTNLSRESGVPVNTGVSRLGVGGEIFLKPHGVGGGVSVCVSAPLLSGKCRKLHEGQHKLLKQFYNIYFEDICMSPLVQPYHTRLKKS